MAVAVQWAGECNENTFGWRTWFAKGKCRGEAWGSTYFWLPVVGGNGLIGAWKKSRERYNARCWFNIIYLHKWGQCNICKLGI